MSTNASFAIFVLKLCNLYWSQTAKVRVGDSYTSQFQVKKGVRQGCILSPVLFNIYSEELINEALSQFKGATFNGVSYTNIRFADDTMVVAESEEELQKMIDSINTACEEYGMALNAKKTKTMLISKFPEENPENPAKLKSKVHN